MRREHVRDLLERVANGELAADAALDALALEPVESLGFATIDHHRALLAAAHHEDTRRCLLLLAAILETPSLAERLLEVLRPELAPRHPAIAVARPTSGA